MTSNCENCNNKLVDYSESESESESVHDSCFSHDAPSSPIPSIPQVTPSTPVVKRSRPEGDIVLPPSTPLHAEEKAKSVDEKSKGCHDLPIVIEDVEEGIPSIDGDDDDDDDFEVPSKKHEPLLDDDDSVPCFSLSTKGDEEKNKEEEKKKEDDDDIVLPSLPKSDIPVDKRFTPDDDLHAKHRKYPVEYRKHREIHHKFVSIPKVDVPKAHDQEEKSFVVRLNSVEIMESEYCRFLIENHFAVIIDGFISKLPGVPSKTDEYFERFFTFMHHYINDVSTIPQLIYYISFWEANNFNGDPDVNTQDYDFVIGVLDHIKLVCTYSFSFYRTYRHQLIQKHTEKKYNNKK